MTFNCCDICGLRVLYPDEKVNGNLMSIFGTYMDSTQRFYGVSPALALAIRGPNAQDKVAKIIGPLDYRIAIQTDPDCLSAVFGNLRSRLNIHHVRILDHTTSELVFWFGGRISKGASMDVGLPYKPKDSMPNAVSSSSSSGQPHSKSKKGKRQSGVDAGTDTAFPSFFFLHLPSHFSSTVLLPVVCTLCFPFFCFNNSYFSQKRV